MKRNTPETTTNNIDLVFANLKPKGEDAETISQMYCRMYPYIVALRTLEDNSQLFGGWQGGLFNDHTHQDVKDMVTDQLIETEKTGIIPQISPDSLFALGQALDKSGFDIGQKTLTQLEKEALEYLSLTSIPVKLFRDETPPPEEEFNHPKEKRNPLSKLYEADQALEEIFLKLKNQINISPHAIIKLLRKDINRLINDKRVAIPLVIIVTSLASGAAYGTGLWLRDVLQQYLDNYRERQQPIELSSDLLAENTFKFDLITIPTQNATSNPTLLPNIESTNQPTEIITFTPESLEPSFNFYGIDFSSTEPVTITIFPPKEKVIEIIENSKKISQTITINNGEPIIITFTPSLNDCKYGTGKACIYAFKKNEKGNIIYSAMHSGDKGEGQLFRQAIEGTDDIFTQADFDLSTILLNLLALPGSETIITQGNTVVDNLEITLSSRIPPSFRNQYYAAPLEQSKEKDALDIVAQANPTMKDVIDELNQESVFYFDTCGWKLKGEDRAEEAENYSWSVYVIGIRKKPPEIISYSPTPTPQPLDTLLNTN